MDVDALRWALEDIDARLSRLEHALLLLSREAWPHTPTVRAVLRGERDDEIDHDNPVEGAVT